MKSISIYSKTPAAIVEDVLQGVRENGTDVRDLFRLMKYLEEVHKLLKSNKELQEYIIDEMGKYGKVATGRGVEVEHVSRANYDFTVCGDSEWDKLQDELSLLKGKIKERERFLKSLKKSMADPETGEVISPPAVKWVDYYKIKLVDETES